MGEPKANKEGLWWFWYAILSCCGVQSADADEEESLLPTAAEEKNEEIEAQVEEIPERLQTLVEKKLISAVQVDESTRDFADRRAKRASAKGASRHPTRPVQEKQIPTAGGPQTRTIRGR